jgi:hypothetical protein
MNCPYPDPYRYPDPLGEGRMDAVPKAAPLVATSPNSKPNSR